VAGCGVHEMDLLAREAGDRFIDRFIGLHFLGGPTLYVLACIRAAIKERRHRKITNTFKFTRFELRQKADKKGRAPSTVSYGLEANFLWYPHAPEVNYD
jgi:hypothetical protein